MKAWLGLGSNIGDRLENLRKAIRLLRKTPGINVTKISSVYETTPVGGPVQPDFLNAAVEIDTDLKPERLLQRCQRIEKECGRVRTEHWGPRTLDIDIELYGECMLITPELTIPHPLMNERAFVLRPLTDIAPEYRHPANGLSVKEMLEKTGEGGLRLYTAGKLDSETDTTS